MEFPKPVELIAKAMNLGLGREDIILDFFAGSATTAHAVLDLNKEDGGNRKFIMVQLPEICNENSEAYKAGFKTIADIGKERIRRVIKNIERETDQTLFKNKKMDLGFKVFKLHKSNFKIWDAEQISSDKASIEKQLELHIDHIDYKASQGDILYEILLKAGFELTTKIKKIKLAGKTVYSIEGGAMLICLEKELTKEVIKTMAEKHPSRIICLDRGFANNDQLKTNAVQIMKSKGVDDFRTV
jgi:adenine-specific DNA-methyltransferase